MAKTYLWYSDYTKDTGIRLAERLKVEHGINPPTKKHKKCICWGARLPETITKKEISRLRKIEYLNSVFEIEKNTNKFKALKLLSKKCRVPMPFNKKEIDSMLKQKVLRYPIVARKNQHSGGSGFCILLQNRDLELSKNSVDYYMPFIKTKDEYRVHIFRGKIIRVTKKVPKSSSAERWIRSVTKGWKHEECEEYPKEVEEQAKKAFNSIKLDFCGVDILYSEDERAYVLELNTGMGLNKIGRDLYELLLLSFV